MQIARTSAALVLFVSVAVPATPCSRPEGPSPQGLVRLADVIVRARAESVSAEPGEDFGLARSRTQVQFRILRVLKGSIPVVYITFNGWLERIGEHNRGAVPYQHARSSGDGPCFALGYKAGGEYLLFLKQALHHGYAQPYRLTPYWEGLEPTNEQLFGVDNPWERWVTAEIRKASTEPGKGSR